MNDLRTIISACGAFALLLIASCNGDNSTPNGNNNPGVNNSLCGTVSVDVIASTLGFTGLGAPKDTTVLTQTTCMYPLGGNPMKVSISYNKGMDQSDFDDERNRSDSALSATSTVITGLGDAAYSRTIATITSLFVFKGSIRVMITSGAKLDKEQQLATLIIAKL
jgi:hypothetical protein